MTLISLGEHNYIHFDGPEMTGVSRYVSPIADGHCVIKLSAKLSCKQIQLHDEEFSRDK